MSTTPNFFIVGAPKCGTTSMANWLGEHRNIFMSPAKEPHFFDTDQKRRTNSLVEYERLFDGAGAEHTAVGEASVFYLFSARPNRISCATMGLRSSSLCCATRSRWPIHCTASIFISAARMADFAQAWALDDERRKGRRIPPRAWDPRRMVYRDVCALGEQVERLLGLRSAGACPFCIS